MVPLICACAAAASVKLAIAISSVFIVFGSLLVGLLFTAFALGKVFTWLLVAPFWAACAGASVLAEVS
jgi:hypothetical protein